MKPALQLVKPVKVPPRTPKPDVELRRLLRQRKRLLATIGRVEAQLYCHARRVADQRGQKPRLTIIQLDQEFGQ